MSAKHTPGPWVIEENPCVSPALQVAAFEESGNRHLQILVYSNNQEADARLIVAAPDLLAALDSILSNLDENLQGCFTLESRGDLNASIAIEQARGAITKATGRQA